MSNILIAYFSRTGQNCVNGAVRSLAVGNTEVVARMVAEKTGGDLLQIKTVRTYPEDYTACMEEAQVVEKFEAGGGFPVRK